MPTRDQVTTGGRRATVLQNRRAKAPHWLPRFLPAWLRESRSPIWAQTRFSGKPMRLDEPLPPPTPQARRTPTRTPGRPASARRQLPQPFHPQEILAPVKSQGGTVGSILSRQERRWAPNHCHPRTTATAELLLCPRASSVLRYPAALACRDPRCSPEALPVPSFQGP